MTQGVFFNDMRDKRAVDMSYHIRDFCQKQAITVPPPAPSEPPAYPPGFSKPAQDDKIGQCQPRAQKMEETTFDDLFLRVRLVAATEETHLMRSMEICTSLFGQYLVQQASIACRSTLDPCAEISCLRGMPFLNMLDAVIMCSRDDCICLGLYMHGT